MNNNPSYRDFYSALKNAKTFFKISLFFPQAVEIVENLGDAALCLWKTSLDPIFASLTSALNELT
jgi:hypothetical protein